MLAAERQISDQFAIRVLKALFLVKYVKAFKATTHNLCILMLDSLETDQASLKSQVQQALNLLEQQTYIQRNGEVYEFLTDEEKDVEQEIKNTEVETTDLVAELEKIFFDHVLRKNKIRHDDSARDFSYTRKLDDRPRGREHELDINVISPFHESPDKPADAHRTETVYLDEVRVFLGPDTRLFQDLTIYKQTEKYIRQNIGSTQQESIRRILENKGHQNRERFADLQAYVKHQLSQASLFVAGAEVESSSTDPQTRIIQAFYALIAKAYPNLGMLRGMEYQESMIKTILEDHGGTLLGEDAAAISEPEQEVLSFIQSNQRGGVRTTLKSVLERFERKPYGWSYPAVLCNLAYLYTRNKVELRADGDLFVSGDIEQVLKNTHGHGNVVLEPQAEFTASQIRQLKAFFEDFFDSPPQSSEAKALGIETGQRFKELADNLNILSAQSAQYPFLLSIASDIEALRDFANKPYTWFLSELASHEEELFQIKEERTDPIQKFMGGSQKQIYDDISDFLRVHHANFAYVQAADISSLSDELQRPDCFRGNKMQQLKGQYETAKKQLQEVIKQTQDATLNKLATLQSRLQSMEEYQGLPADRHEELDKPFADLTTHIQQAHLIAVINDALRHFEEEGYKRLLQKVTELSSPATPGTAESTDSGSSTVTGQVVNYPEYIKAQHVEVAYPRAWLASEADLEEYLKAVRKAFLEEINKGKRVQI